MLTSGEVQQLLEAHGRPLSELPSARLHSLVAGIEDDGQLYGLPGGSGAASSVHVNHFTSCMSVSSLCHQGLSWVLCLCDDAFLCHL